MPVMRDDAETIDRMRAEIRQAAALTDKPVGLNVLLMGARSDPLDEFTAKWIHMALDEGVRHFVSIGNASEHAFAMMKNDNGIIIHRPLTPSVANMREAEGIGADILVATGYDEGGHMPVRGLGTFTVVPTMVDAVSVPVMATGGINDRRGVRAAFALGAEGVFLGTRFIATLESPAAETVKKKIVASGFDDMLMVSDRQRSIRTRTAERLAALYLDKNNQRDLNREIADLGGLRPGMLESDMDAGIISVNTGIDIITSVPSVRDLVEELMA